MPELPDVEAMRRYLLAEGLVGRAMTGASVLWPKAIQAAPPEGLADGVSGWRIQEVARRAKFLLLRLEKGGTAATPRPRRTLIVHLRMTGSLLLEPSRRVRPRHTRNAFHLDDGRELRFVDPRKLGVVWLVDDEADVLSGLGPEPLDPSFTPAVLAERLRGHGAPVKAVLCDQAVLAGIGNIYADEVLFAARVHPLKRAAALSPAEVRRLHRAIVEELPKATERLARLMPLGAPPTESEDGLALLLVPRSPGLPCSRCRTPVERLVIRGRSAYLCPRCQSSPQRAMG